MHELSIAMSLVDLACEEADTVDGRIVALHLRLGALAGVVKEALLFSFGVAATGTPIEGATLVIEDVRAVVFCADCNEERELTNVQHFHCPMCGAFAPNVVRGRELQLFAMEIEENVATHR